METIASIRKCFVVRDLGYLKIAGHGGQMATDIKKLQGEIWDENASKKGSEVEKLIAGLLNELLKEQDFVKKEGES